MNKNIFSIKVAECAVGKESTTIETSSVGSCVVVCLYDEQSKIGGMAHSMLPSRTKDDNVQNIINDSMTKPAKYVNEAIDYMVREIEKLGGNKSFIKAKIIGGSEMFHFLSKTSVGIGQENIIAAHSKLKELHIPIISEDTGGTVGRSASFNIENGVLSVSVTI